MKWIYVCVVSVSYPKCFYTVNLRPFFFKFLLTLLLYDVGSIQMRRFTLVTACVTLLTWTCCCMTFWTGGPGLCLFRLQVFFEFCGNFLYLFPHFLNVQQQKHGYKLWPLKPHFSWNKCKHLMIEIIFSRGWVRNNSLIQLESEITLCKQYIKYLWFTMIWNGENHRIVTLEKLRMQMIYVSLISC